LTGTKGGLAAVFAGMLIAAPALADAGFVLPHTFHLDSPGRINVSASFSDTFPLAGVALISPDFAVETADGARTTFDRTVEFASMTLLETELSALGTVRLTSGERLGRKGEVARLGGRYVRLGDGGTDKASLPAGTPVLTSQTATVSEAYVTLGSLPETFAFPRSARLALEPLQHPGGLMAGDTFRVRISFDGVPFAAMEGGLIPAFAHLEGHPDGWPISPDADGLLTLGPLEAGAYVLLVRHVAETLPDAETEVYSYSTTLTFEVRATP
jgi:hypothetical protein